MKTFFTNSPKSGSKVAVASPKLKPRFGRVVAVQSGRSRERNADAFRFDGAESVTIPQGAPPPGEMACARSGLRLGRFTTQYHYVDPETHQRTPDACIGRRGPVDQLCHHAHGGDEADEFEDEWHHQR